MKNINNFTSEKITQLMWGSHARSCTKSTLCSLGAVRGVQWTFSTHSTYLLKSQSENKKSSWSVWIYFNHQLLQQEGFQFFLLMNQFFTPGTIKRYKLSKILYASYFLGTNIERKSASLCKDEILTKAERMETKIKLPWANFLNTISYSGLNEEFSFKSTTSCYSFSSLTHWIRSQ